MKDLQLTPSQERAFNLFKKGHNIFLTGKGGSGKSFLTRHIIEYCYKNCRSVIVCAPTGIAAINVGGATIHRTFQVPVRIIKPTEYLAIKDISKEQRAKLGKKEEREQEKLDVIRQADVVIIDEISMCRLDLFGFVARTLLNYEGKPKQLLVVGDFYQLPPVLSNKTGEYDAWKSIMEYAGKLFAFESEEWKRLNIRTIELTENMRQKDEVFIKALDDIREGIPNFTPFGSKQRPQNDAITLCPTNKKASEENQNQLYRLIKKGAKHQYFDEEVSGELQNSYDLEKYRVTSKKLELCVGARVIVLVNDKDGKYVNGDMGEVIDLHTVDSNNDGNNGEDNVGVKLDNGQTIRLCKYSWKIQEYQMVEQINKTTGKKEKVSSLVEIGSIKQIPVKLAWAISVHKSQGQTYEKCNIKCGFWTEGQMYVALSRCRSLEGLRILGQLKTNELLYSETVRTFMKTSISTESINVTEISNDPSKPEQKVKNPKGAGRKPKSDQTTVRKHLLRLTETEKLLIEKIRNSEDFRNIVCKEFSKINKISKNSKNS